MFKNKIFLNISINIDKAYDTNSRLGKPLRIDHPNYNKRLKYKRDLEDNFQKIIKILKIFNAEKGVTWFINETSYLTSEKYPEMLKKILETGGELAMQTDFTSSLFQSNKYYMSSNSDIWLKEGIIEPKERLEKFLDKFSENQKKINIFKSTQHVRNKVMFEKIIENGFEIDKSCLYNTKNIINIENKNIIKFNDLCINIEPFYIKLEKNEIFEIPEIKLSLENYKKSSIVSALSSINSNDVFVSFNISMAESFDNLYNFMNFIKSNYELEYLNSQDMKKEYLKINKINKNIKNILPDANWKLKTLTEFNIKSEILTINHIENSIKNNIIDFMACRYKIKVVINNVLFPFIITFQGQYGNINEENFEYLKNKIPFSLKNTFDNKKNYNYIYVCDLLQLWGSLDFINILTSLQNIISYFKIKHTVCIGSSAGGYQSILFGSLLNSDKIIAFVPQIDIFTSSMNDFRRKLFFKYELYNFKYINLNILQPFKTKVKIFRCKAKGDIIHTSHLDTNDNNLDIIVISDAEKHGMVPSVLSKDKFRELIDKETSFLEIYKM